MKKHKALKPHKVTTFKLWALPASAMPVLVSFAYMTWKGIDINWLYGAGTLIVIMIWAYLLGEALSRLLKIRKFSALGYIIMLAGILRAKNARDIQAPTRCTAQLYGLEVLLPMTVAGICSMIGILPMHTIILFMTSPVAVALFRTMKRGVKEGPRPVVDLDTRTVNFLLTFSTLMIAALASARFIS